MKKIIELTTPVKAFAAMLFAGFICLYMVGGVIYANFVDASFDYTISFIHLLKGIGFSTLLSLLWGICFSDVVIKKWKFFHRYLLFDSLAGIVLVTLLLISYFTSMDWLALWFIVAIIISIFTVVLALLREFHFRKTGAQYTELLRIYQANQLIE